MLLFNKTGVKTIIDIRSPEDIKTKQYPDGLFRGELQYLAIPIRPWTMKKLPPEHEGNIVLEFCKEPREQNGHGFYEIFPLYFKVQIVYN